MLQKHAIGQAEQRQSLRQRRVVRDQQHQQQGLQIRRQWGMAREPHHPFIAVAEVLAQPHGIGRLQPAAAQDLPNRCGSTLPGVGEHGQSRRSALQGAGQGLRAASMQAHPGGVLPGAADPCERQLHRAWSRVKVQGFRRKGLQQATANPEPERIAAGQDHHRRTL